MIFKINDKIEIEAEYYETRYSWGHKAWLSVDGRNVEYKKITYYNRTWESYQFQSILYSIIEKTKALTKEEKEEANKWIKEYQEPNRFRHIEMVAKMGEILTDNKKDANDWKERMLKAGLPEGALQMPEDWNELSEMEKENRLNGAIQALS